MEKPILPHGYLGPQPKFHEYQLATLSHHEPEIDLQENRCEIKLTTKERMKVTSNLIHCGTDKHYRELVFTQTLGDVVTLLILLPSSGYFKLQIYALPASDDSKTLPGVYNYLLYVNDDPKGSLYPFPKQYAQWKEGGYLESPYNLLDLPDLSAVKFRARIPGAKSVAVVLSGKWNKLEKKEDEFWEGTVDLSAGRGGDATVSLNANFGEDITKFTTLLEYPMSEAAL